MEYNLWDKYSGLLSEGNVDKDVIEEDDINIIDPKTDVAGSDGKIVDKYRNMAVGDYREVYNKDKREGYSNIINNSLTNMSEKMSERACFEGMKILRGLIRKDIVDNNGFSEKVMLMAKKKGFSDEQIKELIDVTMKPSATNWAGWVTHAMMDIYEDLGKAYGVYYMANPKYIADPEEAIKAGAYFEPSSLIIVHYQNDNIEEMNLIRQYGLDYEEMNEDVSNVYYQWAPLKIGKNLLAYTVNSDNSSDQPFIILKLNGTWEKEYLEPYKLTYAINAILLNDKSDLIVNEGASKEIIEKSVSLYFKGIPLEEFYGNQDNYENINSKTFNSGESGSTYSVSKDLKYIYQNNKDFFKKINSLGKVIDSIANNAGLEGFQGLKYVFYNLGGSDIDDVKVVWTIPSNDSMTNEFWSLGALEYNRKDINYEGFNPFETIGKVQLLSTMGRRFKGPIPDDLTRAIYNIYVNSGLESKYVSNIEANWRAVDPGLFSDTGVWGKGITPDVNFVSREEIRIIAFTSFVINGLGSDFKENIALDLNSYKEVFNTFRSTYKCYLTDDKGNDSIIKDPNPGKGKYTIDHIDGNHGNPYFGNLRPCSKSFNSKWSGTYGIFLFQLTPTGNNNGDTPINWYLKFNNDYKVVLPVGMSSNDEYTIDNNFNGMFSLNISGADTSSGNFEPNVDHIDNAPANEPVKLYIKGISVFNGKKESREIYAGLDDIAHSGFKNSTTGEDINSLNIQYVNRAMSLSKTNLQYAGNSNGETIQNVINKRYANVLAKLNQNTGIKNISLPKTGEKSQNDGNQQSSFIQAIQNTQDYTANKANTAEGKISGKTLFSEIISDFIPALNEEETVHGAGTSGNRRKQVIQQCQFKNMTLNELAEKMIESYTEAKKINEDDENTTVRSSTHGYLYQTLEFGIRTDNELLKKYEGTTEEDWLPVQYIDIHANKSGSNLEFDNAEKKWKCIPKKYPELRVSRLGRVIDSKNQIKTTFDFSSYTTDYPDIKGVGDLHIIVASSWKEEECNITINQEKRPIPEDNTQFSIVVHHINGNQADARAENLEWVNSRDNTNFDSGKGIALFRVVPGTREEIPLLAWAVRKKSTYRDPKTNEEKSEYVDTFWGGNGKMISNTIKLPKGVLKERLVNETARLGRNTITSDSVLYILRNVVLLDRKDKERNEVDRINDIIGYEQIINGNKVMINDSTGDFIEIPTELKQVNSENIPFLYLRGNISKEILDKELEGRPDEQDILDEIDKISSKLGELDDLSKIDHLNKNGYRIYTLDKEHQSIIWGTDESGMLPNERLEVLFNELIKGNVAMFTLTDPIIKQLYSMYVKSQYSVFNGGPDTPTERVDLMTFEHEAKKYYYNTKKILNNKSIYNVTFRRGLVFIDEYMKGRISFEKFSSFVNRKNEKNEILKTLRSKEQSLSILKTPDRVMNLAHGKINVFKMDTTDQDIIWGAENGILKDPDLSYVMKRIYNYIIPIYTIPKNTVRQYMDRTSEKMGIEDFYNAYEQKRLKLQQERLERKKEMKMRKLNRQKSDPQERGLELSGIQSKIANLLEDLNKLSL